MAPTTQKALVLKEPGVVHVVSDKPYPSPAANEIVINVKAVTLNPTDWKHVDKLLKPGDSVGCDFAGDVVEVGKDAEGKGIKVGDGVAGFVRGGYVEKDNGSFQEYVKTLPELVWKKPASLPYKDASAMGGIGLSTAVLALLYRLDLPKPWESSPTSKPAPLLVWAGSTSVGLFAIHLAAASGVPVIATASPHNHGLLKALGASEVFDYRDKDVVSKIQAWGKANGGLSKAFDTISEHGSTELVAQALSPQGGKTVILLPVKEPSGGWPTGVEIEHILLYTVLKPKNERDFADIQEWHKNLPALIESGKIRNSNPLRTENTGLEGVIKGLDDLRAGKASAQKFAYTL